jgi:hypothetical protein
MTYSLMLSRTKCLVSGWCRALSGEGGSLSRL